MTETSQGFSEICGGGVGRRADVRSIFRCLRRKPGRSRNSTESILKFAIKFATASIFASRQYRIVTTS